MLTDNLLKLIPKYSETILIVLTLLFGASTNAFLDYKRARDKKEPYGFIDFMIAIFVAAFAGLIFGFIAETFGFTGAKMHMMVGVGAFMGIAGVNGVVESVLDMVKTKLNKGDR